MLALLLGAAALIFSAIILMQFKWGRKKAGEKEGAEGVSLRRNPIHTNPVERKNKKKAHEVPERVTHRPRPVSVLRSMFPNRSFPKVPEKNLRAGKTLVTAPAELGVPATPQVGDDGKVRRNPPVQDRIPVTAQPQAGYNRPPGTRKREGYTRRREKAREKILERSYDPKPENALEYLKNALPYS